MAKKQAVLLWMDLEMTGLDPEKDRIVEVAAIATDWQFREYGETSMAVKVPVGLMRRRMVGEFWEKNDEARRELLVQNATGESARKVEKRLLEFIEKYFGETVYLAGNSIHNDRRFIVREWKKLDERLHYRMLDVSAWKLYFEEVKGMKFVKPDRHRALDDIRGSIEELKWYLKRVS